MENIKSAKLEDVMTATSPEEGSELEQIVQSSQLSWSGSGWPVNNEDSMYNEEAKLLKMKHTEADYEAGLRAYMPDLLAALRCHMD
eukprot:452029-Amphidinium_carterae.1